jgi:hypothetical protein
VGGDGAIKSAAATASGGTRWRRRQDRRSGAEHHRAGSLASTVRRLLAHTAADLFARAPTTRLQAIDLWRAAIETAPAAGAGGPGRVLEFPLEVRTAVVTIAGRQPAPTTPRSPV